MFEQNQENIVLKKLRSDYEYIQANVPFINDMQADCLQIAPRGACDSSNYISTEVITGDYPG